MTTERRMTWDEVVAKMVEYRNERDNLRTQLAEEQAKVRELVEVLKEIAANHGNWNNGIWAANISLAAIAKYGEQK